jgi:hypothetical protein
MLARPEETANLFLEAAGGAAPSNVAEVRLTPQGRRQ